MLSRTKNVESFSLQPTRGLIHVYNNHEHFMLDNIWSHSKIVPEQNDTFATVVPWVPGYFSHWPCGISANYTASLTQILVVFSIKLYNSAVLINQNKNFFSTLLQEMTIFVECTSAGSWFQAVGTSMANAQVPKYAEVWQIMRSLQAADHRLCLAVDCCDWLIQTGKVHRYSSMQHLESQQAQLKLDMLWARSHCRQSSSMCLMMLYFLAPRTRLTVTFRMDCRQSSWYRGAMASRLLQ